jgi:hypothetical protein
MSKTPYEIRLDLLKIAQDQMNQRYYNDLQIKTHNATVANTTINEVPEFPDASQLLIEAEKLKGFIDRG